MIPRTYPSSFAPNGQNQMVVFLLTSVVGLVKWTDYIPVKWSTSSLGRENDYGNDSFVNIDQIVTLVSGQKPFVDYIPVFVDASATIPWSTNAGGYIPINVSLSTPVALFSQGEQGAWYDPSDMSTMFQDSAGATPVTAAGQPVGRILDKSGRGNHAFQITTTKRPLYQSAGGYSYLAFDGVDDALVTAVFTTPFPQPTFYCIGAKFNTLAATDQHLTDGNSVNRQYIAKTSQGLRINAGASINSFTPDFSSFVMSSIFNAGSSSVRKNANLIVSGNAGSATLGQLFIGSNYVPAAYFNGNIYSLIVRGAQSSVAQIASTEQYVNSRTGAY